MLSSEVHGFSLTYPCQKLKKKPRKGLLRLNVVWYVLTTPVRYNTLQARLLYRKNGSGPIKSWYGPDILRCKPSVPCFHEMDPDSPFSGCLWPQNRKKKSLDPFCCPKAPCKLIFVQYHLLHVNLPSFSVVSHVCTIALYTHKPDLIATRVND